MIRSRPPFWRPLAAAPIELGSHVAGYRAILGSRQFWVAEGLILMLVITDEFLDRAGFTADVYFIPASIVWAPIMLLTFRYGIRGALAASSSLVLFSIPNWFFWHLGVGRIEEIVLVLVAVLTSLFVGRQADLKIAAERRARDYSAYSVRSQEEVLRRVSLDLHDQSLQTLMAACQQIDLLRHSSPLKAELGELRNSLDRVVRELRNIVRDLHPLMLDDLGVVPAIRQLLADFTARTGLSHEFTISGRQREIPPEVEAQLFRIAQEGLRNVERHSGAGKATISATFSPGEVRLEIIDNGAGFDGSRLQGGLAAGGHFGIMGMLQRAESVNGKVDIASAPGRGTRITVHMPLAASTRLERPPQAAVATDA